MSLPQRDVRLDEGLDNRPKELLSGAPSRCLPSLWMGEVPYNGC